MTIGTGLIFCREVATGVSTNVPFTSVHPTALISTVDMGIYDKDTGVSGPMMYESLEDHCVPVIGLHVGAVGLFTEYKMI